MNIYLITQSVLRGYDVYDSAIVSAESAEAAQKIHPSNGAETLSMDELEYYESSWCGYEHVEVELLGKAVEGTKQLVLCSSFRSG